MRELKNKVAVITGAASGIGRALAHRLHAEGSALALSDIDEGGVLEVAESLSSGPSKVTAQRLDVSDRGAVHSYAEEVQKAHGTAHLVINNAGVGHADLVHTMSYDDLEWVMGINFYGVVHGTKAFLPILLEQNEGHIVNISSVFGLVGIPSQSPYCASKFAVRGFTESLRQELGHSDVRISCVHPGGVKTNIAQKARFRRLPNGATEIDPNRYDEMFRLEASDAARVIVDGIKKDRARILVGGDARFLDWIQRLLPVSYTRMIERYID